MPSFPEPSSQSTFTKRHGVSTPEDLNLHWNSRWNSYRLHRTIYRILIPQCHLRSALFWDITQRTLVIPYRIFSTTHQSYHQDIMTLEDGRDLLSRNVGEELALCAA